MTVGEKISSEINIIKVIKNGNVLFIGEKDNLHDRYILKKEILKTCNENNMLIMYVK